MYIILPWRLGTYSKESKHHTVEVSGKSVMTQEMERPRGAATMWRTNGMVPKASLPGPELSLRTVASLFTCYLAIKSWGKGRALGCSKVNRVKHHRSVSRLPRKLGHLRVDFMRASNLAGGERTPAEVVISSAMGEGRSRTHRQSHGRPKWPEPGHLPVPPTLFWSSQLSGSLPGQPTALPGT